MNAYVRPRRTFNTVESDRDGLGQADTVNTRRPVHRERLKRLPHRRLATVLPSIRRLTTEFLPRFGSVETIRRPVDRAAAVPIETAYIRARIRTNLHVEMYLEFILHIISLGTRFWTSGFLLVDESPGNWSEEPTRRKKPKRRTPKVLTHSLSLFQPVGLPIYVARVPAAPFVRRHSTPRYRGQASNSDKSRAGAQRRTRSQ